MSMGGLMAEVTMESESRFAINTLTREKNKEKSKLTIYIEKRDFILRAYFRQAYHIQIKKMDGIKMSQMCADG